MADTVHETLRVRQDLADRVAEHKAAGESKNAAYNRIIETGLDALDGMEPPSYEPPEDDTDGTASGADDADLVAELRARVADLTEERDWLRSQVEVRDQQLTQAQQQVSQAQQTTALATQSATRRRGLLGWLIGDRRS